MVFGLSLKGDALRARSLRSALLTGLNFGGANLMRLGGNLILTRILFPEVFGIMALVQVIMAGLNMFSDVGIRASIIQNERGENPVFQNTAWVIQIGRGVFLWLVTCAMARPIATFYDTPILAQLLPVAGLVAVIQGFNSTKLALANRALLLGRMTAIQLGSAAVGLGTLIGLALVWESVWALVIGSLVAPFLVMILSHMALPGPNNRFQFEKATAHSLVSFGKYIFLSTVAGFLISHADRALLGKFVSLSDLAFYNIAFMFASIPLMMMRKINEMVLFPLYSRRPPANSAQNYHNIARARWLVIGVVMAMLATLATLGNQLIVALYDPRYEIAGALVVLIAIATTPLAVTGTYGSMILAAGHSGRFAALAMSSAILRSTVLFFSISTYGIIGAIATPVISTILFYPALVLFLRPYKGWIPLQDAVFSLVAVAITAVAIWVNYDAVTMAIALFGANPPEI